MAQAVVAGHVDCGLKRGDCLRAVSERSIDDTEVELHYGPRRVVEFIAIQVRGPSCGLLSALQLVLASGRIVATGGIGQENAVLQFRGLGPAVRKEDLSGVTGPQPIKLRLCLWQPLRARTGGTGKQEI